MTKKKSASAFRVGDRVRIRSWENMEKEFGLDDEGDIEVELSFTQDMRPLCGMCATIESIRASGGVSLGDWSEKGDTGWAYHSEMIELVKRAKPKGKKKPVKKSIKKPVKETKPKESVASLSAKMDEFKDEIIKELSLRLGIDIEKLVEQKEETDNGVFKPKNGEIHWHIWSEGRVDSENYDETINHHTDRLEVGNSYKTEEQCQAVVDLKKHIYKFPVPKEGGYFVLDNDYFEKYGSDSKYDICKYHSGMIMHNLTSLKDREERICLLKLAYPK